MPDSTLQIARIDSRRDGLDDALDELRERLSPQGNVVSDAGRRRTIEVFGEPLSPVQVVAKICHEVRTRGLASVIEYTAKLDGVTLTPDTLRVSEADLSDAHARAEPSFLETVRRIRANVTAFQSAVVPRDAEIEAPHGGRLIQRYLPLRRVGICVPGGAAAYPSTVLMTAVPAQVAGVREIAVVAPPTKFGANNADLLATCHELGITEVYRIGGAQGVAAMAYGIDGLPRVDKVVGPGNLFVALAKRHVYGEVDIDSIAGPSEIVVIADETARPDFVAADLIAQAEHDPGASILITWSESLLEATRKQLEAQLPALDRGDAARRCLEAFGALILVRNLEEAAAVTNSIAPEHLHIQTADAESLAAKIENAGAIFLGPFSPVALGDYVAGPSHVLPTGGTARYGGPLSAADFVKSTSIIAATHDGLAGMARDVQTMADKEGLTAHRASVDIRLDAEPRTDNEGAS